MHGRGDDHEARAPDVQAAQQPAERHLLDQEAHAVVGQRRRRHVVHRQADAGHELQAGEQRDHAAGREGPAGAGRQRLVEGVRRAAPGSRSANRASRGARRPWRPLDLDEHTPVSDSGLQPAQRRRRRTSDHPPVDVVDAAVARAEELAGLGVVAGAAAQVRAGRVERQHAGRIARQVDDAAIHDLAVAVLPGDPEGHRRGSDVAQIVERGGVEPARRMGREARAEDDAAEDVGQRRRDRGLDEQDGPHEEAAAGGGKRSAVRHDVHLMSANPWFRDGARRGHPEGRDCGRAYKSTGRRLSRVVFDCARPSRTAGCATRGANDRPWPRVPSPI